MILGISGACRREELTKLTINDIQDKESLLVIKIPTTKTGKPRTFVIEDEFYTICKKYMALRPNDVETPRFFLNYHNGKCTKQPVGINKFSKMPQIIASYLKLREADSYTGHTFRRTSATLLADSGADITTVKRHGGWKSSSVAEGYIEDSVQNKRKIYQQITNSIKDTNAVNIETINTNKENVDIFNDILNTQAKNISISFTNCTINNITIDKIDKK